jgi:hypothetical protein
VVAAVVVAATEEDAMSRLTIRSLSLIGVLLLAACAAQSTAPAASAPPPAERAPLPASSIGSY